MEKELIELYRANARMESYLQAIQDYAKQGAFGSWRGYVYTLAAKGLRRNDS